MKDYVRDVSDLTSESNQQSDAFFKLMNGPGGRDQAVDVQNSLNGFRVQSAQPGFHRARLLIGERPASSDDITADDGIDRIGEPRREVRVSRQ